MAQKLRKITVAAQPLLWCFSGRWHKDRYLCHVTLLSEDRNNTAIITFACYDTVTAGNPLNEGLYMIKNDTEVRVNLNQPRFIAEMVSYLPLQFTDKSTRNHIVLEGKCLLDKMGYQDVHQYLL
jgi:hypothetical protein